MSRKKIVASTTTNDGWVQPKPKKKRKPMTPEQKVAAAERLAKARAARKPAKNESIHHSVLALDDVLIKFVCELKGIVSPDVASFPTF